MQGTWVRHWPPRDHPKSTPATTPKLHLSRQLFPSRQKGREGKCRWSARDGGRDATQQFEVHVVRRSHREAGQARGMAMLQADLLQPARRIQPFSVCI